jgi:RimJ/RimL family protein N-acetyltransferase
VPEALFTSARLVATPAEDGDLDALLAVRLSNPERLLRTEGLAGQPGRYDRGLVERDLLMAAFDPERELLALRLRGAGASGPVIGLVDLLVTNLSDQHPWLGAVEIAAGRQRNGYGREAARAAIAYLAGRNAGGAPVRAVIDSDDVVALAFAGSCGFTAREVPAGLVLRGDQVLLELAYLVP